MKRQVPLQLVRTAFLLAVAGMLASCDTPEKRALRELALAGVEPTGGALLDAVERNDAPLVRSLVAAGVHTERADGEGKTPLRLAVERGEREIITRLIVAKADVGAVAADGSSVLGAAAVMANPDLLAELLKAGAKPDTLVPEGEKLLPWMILNKHFGPALVLMDHHPDPHAKDKAGNPVLHLALRAGRKDLVERLIAMGADPGQVDARGETTLIAAIRNKWYDFIPTLVRAGADPNLPGPLGPSPLSQAVIDGDLKLVDLLLSCGADANYRHPFEGGAPDSVLSKSPLELAFFHADRRVFQIFTDRRIRFEQEKIDQWFCDAMEKRDQDLARLLLSRGANPSFRHGGWLPIEMAVARGDGTAVKMLVDYGSPAGRSFHLAALRGDVRMTRLLLLLGMNPDVVHPPYLDRPLSIAIRSRHDAVAAALIRHGAKTTFRIPEGQTPFHLAVVKSCPETVAAFLETGADPNAPFQLPVSAAFIKQARPGIIRWALKMDRNVTLLMVAADSGNTASARHLIDAGAKKNTWARVSSLWPINFASRRSDVKMMRLILGRDPHREERHIIVRLGEQRATMFDAAGNEIFNTQVSTGRKGFATPTGTYVITNKHRDWTSTIYHASMPYFQRLSCGDFGLHAGNVPGYPASHGCIRVPAGNAAKLFSMTEAGDRVMIVP